MMNQINYTNEQTDVKIGETKDYICSKINRSRTVIIRKRVIDWIEKHSCSREFLVGPARGIKEYPDNVRELCYNTTVSQLQKHISHSEWSNYEQEFRFLLDFHNNYNHIPSHIRIPYAEFYLYILLFSGGSFLHSNGFCFLIFLFIFYTNGWGSREI